MRKKVRLFKSFLLLLLAVVLLIGGVVVLKDGYATYPWGNANNRTKYVYDTWKLMSWNTVYGFNEYDGSRIWSDGVNTYCFCGGLQLVLDVENHTWVEEIDWKKPSGFSVRDIWSDGVNYYCSFGSGHYVLDVELSEWFPMEWNIQFFGSNVGVIDGECYCRGSRGKYYKFNSSDSMWNEIDLSWLDVDVYFSGFWYDGANYHYSTGNYDFLVDFDNCVYAENDNGVDFYISPSEIWKVEDNIFYSYQDKQYVFDVDSQKWLPKAWNELVVFDGEYVWSDGVNYYYSKGADQYVLVAD